MDLDLTIASFKQILGADDGKRLGYKLGTTDGI